MEAPIARHRETIRPEWIDYNGHMNVAYYGLVFDHATDVFLELVGVDERSARAKGSSTFALEAHITYKRELLEGDPVLVTTQLIDFDAKRMHYFHRMFHAREDYLAATLEQISLHVDLAVRRGAEMPKEALDRLSGIMAAHRNLERPKELGSRISIRR